MRRLAVILVGLVVAVGFAGCGKAEQEDFKALQAAIRKTERLSYRYVYSEAPLEGEPVEVRGIIEDDFRYKAQLAIAGQPAMEEVVVDDTLADRFFVPAALKMYVRPEGPPKAPEPKQGQAPPVVSPIPVADALSTKRWVVDPRGAPSLLPTAAEERVLGEDPIYDSLSVLRYVESVSRAMAVYEFNEDALDYRPDEDPFRDLLPDKLYPGQDVTRYDVARPRLPRASDAVGGNQATPAAVHFRYMAVFVNKDGIILRVDEDLDVAQRLDDLRKNYDLDLPPDPDEAIRIAIRAINAVRTGQGDEAIRVRRMSFRLTDIGKENAVALPSEDVVPGSLAVLKNRGGPVTGEGLTPSGTSQAAQGG